MENGQSATTETNKNIASLKMENGFLREENQQLKHRVEWFEKQLFGQKSEKRVIDNPQQHSLLSEPVHTEAAPEDKVSITYQRGKAKKQRPENCTTDAGLRFSDEVPVEIITVTPKELQGPPPSFWGPGPKMGGRNPKNGGEGVIFQWFSSKMP